MPWSRRSAQPPRGLVRLGTLAWLLVLAGGFYLGFKLVPPYWAYLSMLEPVKDAAIMAAMPGKEAQAKEDLIAKAKRVGLELDEEQVEIVRDGSTVLVRVEWSVAVEFPRYRHTLQFHVESRSPLS